MAEGSSLGAAGDCLLPDLSREEEGPVGILRGSDTIDLLDRILVLVPLFISNLLLVRWRSG